MRAAIVVAAALLAGAAAPMSVTLPDGFAPYPDLPGVSADAVNTNCLGCHSAEMVLTQPRLTQAEWAAEVAKMRDVYKAPVDPGEDAAIVAWLVAAQRR